MRIPLSVAIVLLTVLGGCGRNQNPHAGPAGRARSHSSQSSSAARPVYPYSVVPGGVETRADIEEAARRDPVTAEHLRDVRVDTLEQVTLRSDTMAYVSYRRNGAIFWTRKPVLLAAGEKVLANGKDCIRGRCGNRVSFQPRQPVIDDPSREPAAGAFHTPETQAGHLVLDEIVPPPALMAMALPPLSAVSSTSHLPGPLLTSPGSSAPATTAAAAAAARASGADDWGPGPGPFYFAPGATPPSWLPAGFPAAGGSSITPVTPIVPVTPVTPVLPVTIVTPVTPVAIEPAVAVILAPTVPGVPAGTSSVLTPTVTPVSPASTPTTPGSPTILVTPAAPSFPSTPDVPVVATVPVTPSTPSSPETPSVPVSPTTPPAPDAPASPEAPPVLDRPSTPDTPITPVPPPDGPPDTPPPSNPPSTVPEPASVILLATGVAFLLWRGRR